MPAAILDLVRAVVSRLAGVVVAAIVLWLSDHLGVQVTEEQKKFLVDGVSVVGLALAMASYSLTHRLLSRFINPHDSAKPAQVGAP